MGACILPRLVVQVSTRPLQDLIIRKSHLRVWNFLQYRRVLHQHQQFEHLPLKTAYSVVDSVEIVAEKQLAFQGQVR